MPSISVALCTFNGEKYLTEQLLSISRQNRLPDELVVSDDNSSDETWRILKSFALNASFPVRLSINNENLGTTKNFERAICACSEEIIVLCDQDDLWHPQKLEKIDYQFCNSAEVGLVFSDADLVDRNNRQLGTTLWSGIRFTAREQVMFSVKPIDVLLKHYVVTGATMAFRAKYRELCLPIPHAWIHDAWIALIISSFAKVGVISDTLLSYRQHPAQQIGVMKKDLVSRIKVSKTTTCWDYRAEAQRYSEALNVLTKNGARGEVLFKTREKVEHIRNRAALPKSLLFRIPSVASELFSGRYHRYSRGLFSVATDLLLR